MGVFVIILNLNTICTAGESEHKLGLCGNMNRLKNALLRVFDNLPTPYI